jgi:hypothetical protein
MFADWIVIYESYDGSNFFQGTKLAYETHPIPFFGALRALGYGARI